jgi:hypothetical protein
MRIERLCRVVSGVKNVWRWLPVIWSDADFDWEYLARVMVFKLWDMEHAMRNGVQVCRVLLERLKRDDYASIREAFGCDWSRGRLRLEDQQRADDAKLFGKIMGRHLLMWWD